MNKASAKTIRTNMYIPTEIVRRVDEFASRNSISRTAAVAELLSIGLDGELAGIESALQIQAKIHRELQSLRGLVAAAIDAGDIATAFQMALAYHQQILTKPEDARNLYFKALSSRNKIKQLKKQFNQGNQDD